LLSNKPFEENHIDLMDSILIEYNENFLYYFASKQNDGEQSLNWEFVLTVKNQPKVVKNKLTFKGNFYNKIIFVLW